jgi:succinate-semialdehyde dehydrogenase/glutarate-semialdehyde dehydrogenase
LQIQEAFRESGFPENVFQCIIVDYKAGEALVQSDKIDAVSVTGSVNTGKRIAELAARGLKKCVLELDGSDPFVVLEDADVNQTAHLTAQSRLLNTGQSCIAAKRFIVVKEVAEKVSKLFAQNVEADVVGDPMNSKTTVGPLEKANDKP